jgi:hypothetical protein
MPDWFAVDDIEGGVPRYMRCMRGQLKPEFIKSIIALRYRK